MRKDFNISVFFIGIALIMLGIALIIAHTRSEWGFIVIIGPVPFFIGSDIRALLVAFILLIALLPIVVYFLWFYGLVRSREEVVV